MTRIWFFTRRKI